MLIYLTGFLIIILIFANAITDAPNAISTVVATRVVSFRKAAYISAIFNFIGIICMCFINFSVAKNMATLINFNNEKDSVISIFASILSTIIFAFVALKYGIPTSETHSIIAGLAGASIALENYKSINVDEWKKVIIGLFWSIFCTYLICKILNKLFKVFLEKIATNKIRLFQIFSCMILSFMHGAQDGLKFIGLFIIYFASINNKVVPLNIQPNDYIWVIIFVSSIMSIGVGFGGRNIVENIGSNITKLSNTDAIITDITTGITLFFASFFGIPVSTSHCKTVSIISIGKKINIKQVKEIISAWIITFPVCFFISFFIIKFMIIFR